MYTIGEKKEEIQVKKFLDVTDCGSGSVDSFLEKGYEIIETTKDIYPDGETLTYHLGYAEETHYQELKEIIDLYEKYGLKEELFKKIGESIGENVSDYDSHGGHTANNELVKSLEKYERVVNRKNKKYYKKLTQDEIESKFF